MRGMSIMTAHSMASGSLASSLSAQSVRRARSVSVRLAENLAVRVMINAN